VLIKTEFGWVQPHVDAVMDLFRAYVTRKRDRGMLDFDDLLLAWRGLLRDPVIGPQIAGRWDHVLVDEYQDVNATQVDIVRALRPGGHGLTVVGDDAQAIYGFRGSDHAHLRALVDGLPGVTVRRLERNFRSHQRLLDLANVVRPSAGGEHRITLHSDRREGRAIVDAVLDAHQNGHRLRDQAVLMRASAHSDLLEVELTARGVPFVKYGGLKFLEAAHVKDFVAAVRLLDNPMDEVAWYRLLRLHDGIGPARARALLRTLADPERPVDDDRHAEAVAAAPAMCRVPLAATLQQLAAARAGRRIGERARGCLELLRPLVTARYRDWSVRLGDLERLVGAADQSPDLAAFVAELTLDPPASTSDLAGPPTQDDDYLVLSTVHSAKGLEWPIVHVLHLVDGSFPSDMALAKADGIEEEARLFYVAVTRAADELHLYAPLRMPHHRHARDDRHSMAPISRFLDDAALDTVEVVDLTPPRPAPTPAAAPTRVALPDLADLWA
jgi:DNA helicase-2/ATP-dependent DNA helicase PcrA